MGKCFLYGNGGSNPLNFVVVGGTAKPSNPKENTIWVNTKNAITGYIFSATSPDNPFEGMVWFLTGKVSSAAFSATKKNPVNVYPLSVVQYVGSSWMSVETSCYQNGEWIDFRRYIFKQGEGTDSELIYKPYISSNYQSDMTSERIYINSTDTSDATGSTGLSKGYDFTDYNKLCFDVLSNNSKLRCGFLDSALDSHLPTYGGSVGTTKGKRAIAKLDISNVTGVKYIAFRINNGEAGSAEVYNIYLE